MGQLASFVCLFVFWRAKRWCYWRCLVWLGFEVSLVAKAGCSCWIARLCSVWRAFVPFVSIFPTRAPTISVTCIFRADSKSCCHASKPP